MSTCIIGAGLSGLTAAVNLKLAYPEAPVAVIEKPAPQSNTQIAGQRLRMRGVGSDKIDPEELASLLNRKGSPSDEMRLFGWMAVEEINFWQNYVSEKYGSIPAEDRKEWFGPQWGGGRGIHVLRFLHNVAEEVGVDFYSGEVNKILRNNQYIEGVSVTGADGRTRHLSTENYILANGSIGGSMYESTNKKITHSSQELAYEAGLDLTGGTIQMLHPFGRAKSDGTALVGCYGTDDLSTATVIFNDDGHIDYETTELLRGHRAHDYFKDITRRFYDHGSVVTLDFPDRAPETARVSHHYSHLGIVTKDGVTVSGVNNLYAVGDASNLNYWTRHTPRLPGFAFTKSLVDARLVSEKITPSTSRIDIVAGDEGGSFGKNDESKEIRAINTTRMMAAEFDELNDAGHREWKEAIISLGKDSAIADISIAVAEAYRRKKLGILEPITINKEITGEIKKEGGLPLQARR